MYYFYISFCVAVSTLFAPTTSHGPVEFDQSSGSSEHSDSSGSFEYGVPHVLSGHGESTRSLDHGDLYGHIQHRGSGGYFGHGGSSGSFEHGYPIGPYGHGGSSGSFEHFGSGGSFEHGYPFGQFSHGSSIDSLEYGHLFGSHEHDDHEFEFNGYGHGRRHRYEDGYGHGLGKGFEYEHGQFGDGYGHRHGHEHEYENEHGHRYGYGHGHGYPRRSSSAPMIPCGRGKFTNALGQCRRALFNRKVYVFDGPDLPAIVGPLPRVPRPKVDNNVVFIRTPKRPQEPEPIVVPSPQQKTLLYVVTENKELKQRVIEAPKSPALQPEVTYVNYGSDEDSSIEVPEGHGSLREVFDSHPIRRGRVLGGPRRYGPYRRAGGGLYGRRGAPRRVFRSRHHRGGDSREEEEETYY